MRRRGLGHRMNGVKCGALGDLRRHFRFIQPKNLGAYGDGGLLTTNDDDVAEQARMLRTHGSRVKYHNEILGYNSRLDAIQAAILRVKLPYIDGWNQARQRVAGQYHELLEDVDGVVIPTKRDNLNHIFHQYTIRVLDDKRDAVREHLKDAGISTMVYYPKPIHKLPMYTDLGYELPVTEQASREVLSLPIWPQLTAEYASDDCRCSARSDSAGVGMGYFVHETAIVDEGAQIGDDTKIWHFCHVMPKVVIGERCFTGSKRLCRQQRDDW